MMTRVLLAMSLMLLVGCASTEVATPIWLSVATLNEPPVDGRPRSVVFGASTTLDICQRFNQKELARYIEFTDAKFPLPFTVSCVTRWHSASFDGDQ